MLYLITAVLRTADGAADDIIDRVGFREIRTEGKDILLNGRKLRIKGFCRHEDHPQFGCALPFSAMQHDLMLIKDLEPTPFGPYIIPMMSFFWISVMNRESWSGRKTMPGACRKKICAILILNSSAGIVSGK